MLQFSDVVLLNFFSSVSATDQRLWKRLIEGGLVNGEGTVKAPHLEPQIKLLYTAITRCCDRLIFVETVKTAAGTAFFRRLRSAGLIDERPPDLSEARLMTADERRQRGLEYASVAEADGSSEAIERLLTQAVDNFQKARQPKLESVARTHLSAVQYSRDLSPGQLHERDVLELVSLLARCLSVGLVSQACVLCESALPHLTEGEAEYVRREVWAKLCDLQTRG